MVLHVNDGTSTGMSELITHIGTESLTTILQQSLWYSVSDDGASTHAMLLQHVSTSHSLIKHDGVY